MSATEEEAPSFPVDDNVSNDDSTIRTMNSREKYNLILPVLLSIGTLSSSDLHVVSSGLR